MATATQRRARRPVPVIAPLVGDVVGLFVKSNPQTPRAMTEAAARVTAALGAAATKLNPKLQRELVAHKDELPDLIASVAAMLRTGGQSRGARRKQTSAQAEPIRGRGLGEQLDDAEAAHAKTRRLRFTRSKLTVGLAKSWDRPRLSAVTAFAARPCTIGKSAMP